jgi:hypothetical protein
VTVCGAEKTSAIAAEQLCDRGLQAVSLEGRMKAWSLAWNTAEVPVEGYLPPEIFLASIPMRRR